MQAIRLFIKDDSDIKSASSPTASEDIHLAVHPDPVSGKDIVLWDDITAAFDDVIQIRSGTFVQSFLKGADFKILDPLRIAAVPGVILDVVVRNKAELSLESLKKSLPGSEADENKPPTSDISITVSGRSPAYGIENVAMAAAMNNDNPTLKLLSRGQETEKDNKSPPTPGNNTPPTLQDAAPKTQAPGSPQETAANAAKNIARTMMNATLGDNKALNALGDMYRDGRGVCQDYRAAMDRYTKAAGQENADAQCNIGQLYHNGHGVNLDYTLAVHWYQKAINQGHTRAKYNLGTIYQGYYRDYAKAAACFLEAANEGFAPAQCSLGSLHQRGSGVPQDYSLAMEWYRKASEQEHTEAQYNIGHLYHQGYSVAQDHFQAMDWYLKAAEKGHAVAQASAGVMYQHGQGVPQDDSLALDWFQRAATQGNANAQLYLGLTYEYGLGVIQDKKAKEWYKKAADRGVDDAKGRLKVLEQQGNSV
ncbi:hypothetical protein BG015_002252 [Linnemannia schmuckeri]|uniref:HCP-like protein n=1 Tax=Linnemannia schmuckeri TaxID=64567 RepID=A0A9P5S6Q0_9FUNG|nr:hypothetical protein BG015_002252 [Linnemannia schmuckeri]